MLLLLTTISLLLFYYKNNFLEKMFLFCTDTETGPKCASFFNIRFSHYYVCVWTLNRINKITHLCTYSIFIWCVVGRFTFTQSLLSILVAYTPRRAHMACRKYSIFVLIQVLHFMT